MTRLALLVATFALVACGDGGAARAAAPSSATQVQPAAPQVSNDHFPLGFTIFNTCTAEMIDVSGEIHVLTLAWVQGSRIRIKGHINLNIAATGVTTGMGYQFQQITNNDLQLDVNSGVGQSDEVFHLNVISQGSAANQYLTMNGTYFYYAGGGVQFVPKKWEFACR